MMGGSASRALKAQKILAVLGDASSQPGTKLLDIGAGSGWIAQYFSRQQAFQVSAVDVVDQREVREGFEFQLAQGTALPFESHSFDIVLSNHVIEHVGDINAQLHHLTEILRVLKPGGKVYLAVPNKWSLTEPHYQLPLLSWFPQALASAYVRAAGRGSWYDCKPLGPLTIRRLLARAGFGYRDRAASAMVEMIRIEKQAWLPALPLFRFAADHFAVLFGVISPTQIFVLENRRESGHIAA